MEIKTQSGTKLFGFYRGQVVKHEDKGMCRIWVPDVHGGDGKTPDAYPIAEQAAPLFGGVCKGNGTFSYPNVGAVVWVFFSNGDQNKPVYFAATLGGENAVDSTSDGFKEIQDNVNNSDKPAEDTPTTGKDSQVHMINCGKARITLRESGEIELRCEDRATNQHSVITMTANGCIRIDANTQISINTPTLVLRGTSNTTLTAANFTANIGKQTLITSPQTSIIAENMFAAKSKSILMDASTGVFAATAKTHKPIFLS